MPRRGKKDPVGARKTQSGRERPSRGKEDPDGASFPAKTRWWMVSVYDHRCLHSHESLSFTPMKRTLAGDIKLLPWRTRYPTLSYLGSSGTAVWQVGIYIVSWRWSITNRSGPVKESGMNVDVWLLSPISYSIPSRRMTKLRTEENMLFGGVFSCRSIC